MRWSAAVLCGGASRRMGQDKALIEVGGTAMARRVADVCRAAGAEEVLAVGGDQVALASLGLEVVPDEQPGAGPLAAVITALRVLRSPVVAVLACDLTAPDPTAVTTVVSALSASPRAQVAVPVDEAGRRQWVHAAWRRSATTALQQELDDGVRSLHRAAEALTLVEVPGLPAAALRDADVPGDLPAGG